MAHETKTNRPNSTLPSVRSFPSCRGCGTSVREAGALCTVCQHRPQIAPAATMQLAAQPEPVYAVRERSIAELEDPNVGASGGE